MTPQDVYQELKANLKQFGEYSYQDKGAHEIMDLPPIVNFLKPKSATEIVNFLESLHQIDPITEILITDLLYDLQDHPQFDQIIQSPILSDLF